MINGDKTIIEFFNKDEINLLYRLKISKSDNLSKAKEILETYIKKLGYSNLEEKPKNDEDEKYLTLLMKIYNLLPVY